ncbi:MAG: sigma-70 family RNA polymerase sigma factor [Oxalicibacterium faecigallinarum]|uniref:sigma-70 family RNA polymerase sigma factor n=1 Tax=Oxalicibacterium faecigallinarum TaxID=573741 RepID=UPI002806E605|nr:sigma-70 family RNA polymerase sigma factor [Oxalicibacterium faecigallinarum]MDQ7968196.1 sigma-70 family RNA polymerase sigma factor [Oxalicibacterium faecigallinarum]
MSAAKPHLHQDVDTLYVDHHGWLDGWLRKRLGNSFDAADLAHDTFVRVLTRDVSEIIREPRAYLTTIAQGLIANQYRRRQVEQSYLDALAQMPEQHAPSPEIRAMMLETLIEIDQLLEGLSVVVRKAFLWSQLDGLSHAEIGERLGISISTVKRHIVKALARCCFAE